MSETQKIIKYLAIFFAIFLIVSIFYSVMFGIASFLNIIDYNEKIVDDEKISYTYENNEISIIDIDLKSASAIIKQGNSFKIETNTKNVSLKKRDNKLYIEEKNYRFFRRENSKRQVIIYLPSEYVYEEIEIESDLGKIDIDKINVNELSLDLGAGEIHINELNVLEKAEIDGGAGQIIVDEGTINNLSLDMGIGKLDLTSKLIGKNEIDTGVGETLINLLGTMNDYKIKVDKGLGATYINGKNIESETYYGSGNNIILIDGGVGKIDISVDEVEKSINDSNYMFEFKIDKYLKDESNDIVIFGKIVNGTASKGSTIKILNSSNEVIASSNIKNKDVLLYPNEINTCSINESCAFIIENISEEQLEGATKIVIN